MTMKEALRLKSGDCVKMKKTKQLRLVTETRVVSRKESLGDTGYVSIRLNDNNWYDHRDLQYCPSPAGV